VFDATTHYKIATVADYEAGSKANKAAWQDLEPIEERWKAAYNACYRARKAIAELKRPLRAVVGAVKR
jgi:hypothetical protein